MADTIEVKVPDIGDFTDVPVIEVLVKPGDTVEKESPLVTLESDKATMEVPSPCAGTVKSVAVKEGGTVSQGDLVVMLEALGDASVGKSGGGAQPAAAKAAPGARAASPATPAVADDDAPPARVPEPAAAASRQSAKTTTGGQGETLTVEVPDIGDFTDVPVIEVLVKPGDHVDVDAPLVTLESDKATMEVPAPQAGIVESVAVKVGDAVSRGSTVLVLQTDGGVRAHAPDAAARVEPADAATADRAPNVADDVADGDEQSRMALDAIPAAPIPPPDVTARGATPHASPSVRKYARELGADLHGMRGSGPKGRILREDVQRFVKGALRQPAASTLVAGGAIPPIPAVDFSQFGPIETQPLSRIRKLSAAHLQRAWLNLPHVTQTDDADITELDAFRRAQNSTRGQKLTLLPFILKAVARAIDEYPEFGASLTPDGQNLVMKHYRHIGFAADTENGLLVPVVRDVDQKGLVQLAKETAELAKKARAGKLSPAEMKGGVFSVSSLGGIGGRYFTPIINAPEVGILGVSRAETRPVWDGTAFQPRLMVPLSLSYDHRVIDGAYAARFIVYLCGVLGDLRRLVL